MARTKKQTLAAFVCFWLTALCTHVGGYGPYGIGPGGLGRPMHCDYSVRLRVARDWGRGLKLYEETYENAMPTVFLFLRLVDSARPELSHYYAEALLAAVGATFLYRALRRTAPACALAAPTLLVVWAGQAQTFYGGQITEAISLWFDVIALACLVLCLRTGRAALAVASGVSFFVMASFRVPCALHGLAYLPVAWVLFRRHGARRGSVLALSFAGGVVASLLALYAHAQALGYWEPFLEVLYWNRQYASFTRVSLWECAAAFKENLGRLLGGFSGYPVLIWFTLATAGPPWRGPLAGSRLWLVVGVLWLGAALASVFPGGRHWPHYYHVTWAPLSLLATLWLSRLGTRAWRRLGRRLSAALISYTLVVAFATSAWTYYRDRSTPWGDTDGRRAVKEAAAHLDRLTTPETPVPICVWGDWTELYWRVPRPSVSRCIAPFCFDEIQPRIFDEWVRAMLAQKPPLLVADRCMLGPSAENPRHLRMPGFSELKEMVDRDYVVIHHVGDLCFLALRGGPFDSR